MKHTYALYDGKAIAYTMFGEEYVLLTHVWVHPSQRLEGTGSRLLKMVLDDADAEGRTVLLNIQPDPTEFALDYNKLAMWYQRNGFQWLDEATGDMVRTPKKEEADGD